MLFLEGNSICNLKIHTLAVVVIILASSGILVPRSITSSSNSSSVELTLSYEERNEYWGGIGVDVFTEWHEFDVTTTPETYLADLSGYSIRGVPICIDVSDFRSGQEVEFLGKTHETLSDTVNWVGAGTFACWQLHYVEEHDRHYYDKTLGILVFSITGGSDWDHEIHLEESNMGELRTFSLTPTTGILIFLIVFELGIIWILYQRRKT